VIILVLVGVGADLLIRPYLLEYGKTPADAADAAAKYLSDGLTLSHKNDLVGALAKFNKALQLDPRNANAYNARAWFRIHKGDFKGAAEDCSESLRLKPDNAATYECLGDVLAEKDDPDLDGAIADYGKALKLSPQDAPVYTKRAIERSIKGDFPGSIEDASEAIQINPGDLRAYNVRGLSRYYNKWCACRLQ
jgi:tetratricopeptide (TPR) repeat protein